MQERTQRMVPSFALRTPAQSAPIPDQLSARILLCEDGLDNQKLVAILLHEAGAEVVVADNGQIGVEEALAADAAGQPFDVILMDMRMPVMDGYLATRSLRAKGYRGPIIALTAYAMAGDREECLDVGCDEYISKPVDRTTLLAMIVEYLPNAQQRAQRALLAAVGDQPPTS
jgi:CheY-like chemotaxis protein